MHDIALLGTADFCGTQTSSPGSWQQPPSWLRYDSFQLLSSGHRCMTSGTPAKPSTGAGVERAHGSS
jgi:hypothetical protein